MLIIGLLWKASSCGTVSIFSVAYGAIDDDDQAKTMRERETLKEARTGKHKKKKGSRK
jgi:hypothetical protein